MNFIVQVNFSVKLTDLALTFFPRENLLIAKNQCHFPREKIQCHFKEIRQIDESLTNIPPNWRIFDRFCRNAQRFKEFFREFKFKQFHSICPIYLLYLCIGCLFSKLCRNTIARSFLGMHWNCQSLGTHFHPSGLRPLGWKKWLPWDWQFQCIPRNDRAII